MRGDAHVGYIRFGLGHGGEDLVDSGADFGACKQMWDAAGYQTDWNCLIAFGRGWPDYATYHSTYAAAIQSTAAVVGSAIS